LERWRRRLLGRTPPAVPDVDLTIETLADVDATARVGASGGTAGDEHGAQPELDGVVAADAPRIATAEDGGEVAGRAPPERAGRAGRVSKAAIEVGDEGGDESIGGLERADPAQSQLTREAVLQRAPESFDAALAWGDWAAM
jgi:hypothetical protein